MKPAAILVLFAASVATVLSAEDAWAPFCQAEDGLASRLVPDRGHYGEGQYLWIYLDVRNVSEKTVKIAKGSGLSARFSLTNELGEVLKPRKGPKTSNVGVRPLSPGKQTDAMLFYVCGNQYAMYEPLKPGRYSATWKPGPDETVKGGRVPPQSNTVTFEVVPRKERMVVPGAEVAEVSFGEEKGGLRTRFRASRHQFYAGNPVPVTVEIEGAFRERHCSHRPQTTVGGWIEVLDASGKRVLYVNHTVQVWHPMSSLEFGKTTFLDELDWPEGHFLLRPGPHAVSYAGCEAWGFDREEGEREATAPAANTLKLEIVPNAMMDPLEIAYGPLRQEPCQGRGLGREEGNKESAIPAINTLGLGIAPSVMMDPLVVAMGLFVENCPKDWSVYSYEPVCYVSQPGPRYSRVRCRSYLFGHRDAFRNTLRRMSAVYPVRVRIAREMAKEEPWELREDQKERASEYLGETPLGHVYMVSPHETSLKHWPDPKADIVKWLKKK